ncbi:uncharacterized protein [Coffea arabica]|uniref:RNase H type-1 domain-containing protein n=1 Tax=Coffea arabica TaxID=13443 RepID=A0ABM4U1F2_COFAR
MVMWWLSSQPKGQRQVVVSILPSFICWHIWKARNKAVWEGISLSSGDICHGIIQDVVLAVSSEVNRWNLLPFFDQFFDRLSEPPMPLQCKIVRWRAAGTRIATLNTDGCSKGNPRASGGGGVLRDSEGRFLIGYSVCLGVSTSLLAEVLALLAGLRFCHQRGFTQVRVQSDSLVLVGILQCWFQCSWQIRREVFHIWQLAEDSGHFSHCFRETNTVADILANEGLLHPLVQMKIYNHPCMLPQLARGALRLDRSGFPSLQLLKRTPA